MRYLLLVLLALTFAPVHAQKSPALMPWPSTVGKTTGQFRLTDNFTVSLEGPSASDLTAYTTRFISRLASRTGIFFLNNVPQNTGSANLKIIYADAQSLKVGVDESYELQVTQEAIILTSPSQFGAMRGLETLLQLLSSDRDGYYFTGYNITDEPRFVWRGLLLDVCRHWLPMEVVKRNIDGMAAVKMNVLHLHLTEDQGFRVESKVYPKLHQMGSDGDYFTQQQIKDIVSYAADRGVRVVPEFDIPGHATSWFIGYPELASAPGPYTLARTYGVKDPTMDPTKEYTYEFLDNFLTEMAGLFPDEYMHIGGDENNGKQWNKNSEISKFKEDQGFASNHELQAYFNGRIAAILTKLNKRMVGWDEIADEDLPKTIVIQSWRGKQALIDAAEAGYDVLLSNGYYIDLAQSAAFHYQNDPLPADATLSSAARQHILGGEATMWSEKVSFETVDSRIWPRTAAIAERLWSSANINDVDNMYLRLNIFSQQLEEHGLTHIKNQQMMMRRMVGEKNVPVLKTLIDVLEPLEGYQRGRYKKYTTFSPLTRIPDIAQPDADAARAFNALVSQYLINKDPNRAAQIKVQLMVWVENHKQMKLLAKTYPAIRETLPMSNELSKISILGLQAMSNKIVHDYAWKNQANTMLSAASEPKIECELKVVDGIQKLVAHAN